MKWIRFFGAWYLYITGHCISKIMLGTSFFGLLYYPYNKLMKWSFEVQGSSNFGPWENVSEEAK